MKVKVCGMTQGDQIRSLDCAGVDFIGMIFYNKSPRCIHEDPSYLPVQAKRVGVFVNAEADAILSCSCKFKLDYIQLHSNESPQFCSCLRSMGLRLIKAFSIAVAADFDKVVNYDGLCDYYLFDTKSVAYGGSGKQFDWSLTDCYHGTTPFLLSGGIGPGDAARVAQLQHPSMAGIDINSRFEAAPGKKDIKMITQFLNELKHYEQDKSTI